MSKRIPLWPVRGLRTTANLPCPAIYEHLRLATPSPSPIQFSPALRTFYTVALPSYRPYFSSPSRHVTNSQRPAVGVTTVPKFALNQRASFGLSPIQWAYHERLYSTKDKPIQKEVRPKTDQASSGQPPKTTTNTTQPSPEDEHESLATSVSKYLHLPHLPHRPTKEELLAAATGFWQRLKVRFKWASIRSMRPWNADEWGAFVSWFMLGHIVWILVGTTTFFSLLIFSINTVFAQGMLEFTINFLCTN